MRLSISAGAVLPVLCTTLAPGGLLTALRTIPLKSTGTLAGLAAATLATAIGLSVNPAGAQGFTFPNTTTVGVLPEFKDKDNWTTGDAGQECVANLGFDFGLKIDNWSADISGPYSGACDGQGSCTLAPAFNNTITINNNDGFFFDWASAPFALGAVVVKGGTGVNVFDYVPPASADTDLYSPCGNTLSDGQCLLGGTPKDVSHASFCWDLQDQGKCYQEETAWPVGLKYNTKRGNWAMYVAYTPPVLEVDIRADGGDGVGIYAGFVTFAPAASPGYLTITVTLEDSFIFYYDLNDDEEDDNLKVQDYASAPNGNPKIGNFAWKTFVPVGSVEGVITVPEANYYGVHLDLAYQVPCE